MSVLRFVRAISRPAPVRSLAWFVLWLGACQAFREQNPDFVEPGEDSTTSGPPTPNGGLDGGDPTTPGSTAMTDSSDSDTRGCEDGYSWCDDACVDTRSTAAHCGGCEQSCVLYQECREGVCCLAHEVICGEVCVDLASSGQHCGACDYACDEHREVCEGGKCVCRRGLTLCGEECVNTRNDPAHCGGCDRPCELCGGGLCRTTLECQSGFASLCDGSCTDVLDDPLNCGRCDNPCKVDELCFLGHCDFFWEPLSCDTCPCTHCERQTCCDSEFLGIPVCAPTTPLCEPP